MISRPKSRPWLDRRADTLVRIAGYPAKMTLNSAIVRVEATHADKSVRAPFMEPVFKRILLKLSGEALMGAKSYGIDTDFAESVALELKNVHDLGVQLAIVVGGGNIFRGVSASAGNMDRGAADYIGMLATVMNAVVLQDALEKQDVYTRVMSAIDIPQLAEPFIRRRAIRHLEKDRVVIFAAGTGNPYFTTDSAAALRALEIDADVIMKATKVDGIYSADPKIFLEAEKYDKISFQEVLEKRLKVMDSSAISLCMDNELPILVFNMTEPGNIMKAVCGDLTVGTLVTAGETAATTGQNN